MDYNNYFDKRKLEVTRKLRAIIQELPPLCYEFFIGIENRTSPLTRLNYAHDLRNFFNFLFAEINEFKGLDKDSFTLAHLNAVTATHIELFVSYLSAYEQNGKIYTNDENGKSRKLACVRSLFKYFYNKDKLSENVAAKVAMPKLHEKGIVKLENNEVERLLDEVESAISLTKRQQSYHEKTKLRDIAIITLFLNTGIRISELIGLNVSDIDFYDSAFSVTRKGGNREILYFNDEVALALSEYMEWRASILPEGIDEQALFLSLQKRRISLRAVENLVKKYAEIASPLKKISPHKLRSTFGTNLYRNTKDIYIVAEFLGHKDINITKKHYADTSEQIKRRAASMVNYIESDDNMKNQNK